MSNEKSKKVARCFKVLSTFLPFFPFLFSLLTAHCSLLPPHSSLLTVHCSLFTVHCHGITAENTGVSGPGFPLEFSYLSAKYATDLECAVKLKRCFFFLVKSLLGST